MNSTLERAASMSVADYNPQLVFDAVNDLQPLGQDGALARLDAYLESRDVSRDANGLFWVMRVLFDVDDGRGFPPVLIGQADIPSPTDSTQLPRFPIVMIQDVPLLAVRGYALGGLPEQPESHAAYYRLHGSVRPQPLDHPPSTDALQSAFELQWRSACGEQDLPRVRETIEAQLARTEWAR